MNFDLADDYDENSRHIQVVDLVVNNDYQVDGKRNPHKIYGYLRTPEFTQVIHDFLGEEEVCEIALVVGNGAIRNLGRGVAFLAAQ